LWCGIVEAVHGTRICRRVTAAQYGLAQQAPPVPTIPTSTTQTMTHAPSHSPVSEGLTCFQNHDTYVTIVHWHLL